MQQTVVRTFLVFAIAGLAATAPAQRVLVVDAAGGAPFADVQSAIHAAADGDTVLVRPGQYQGAIIDDKSLSILGDIGAIQLEHGVDVRNLAAGKRVVLRNLSLGGTSPGAELRDCEGTVWIGDCDIAGPVLNILAGPGGHGALIRRCDSVVLARTRIGGGGPLFVAAEPGSAALIVASSTVHAFDCEMTGGFGSGGFTPGTGGLGAHLADALVHAQGCTFRGGVGGTAAPFGLGCFGPSADGGAGVRATGTTILEHLDSIILGGPGGPATPPCLPGGPGPVSELVGGQVVSVPGGSYGLVATPNPIRSGATLALDVTGPPGDVVWIAFARAANPTLVPFSFVRGPLLVDLIDVTTIPIGAIPVTGAATLSFSTPPLPSGMDADSIFAQVLALNAGVVTCGEGHAISLLAPRF